MLIIYILLLLQRPGFYFHNYLTLSYVEYRFLLQTLKCSHLFAWKKIKRSRWHLTKDIIDKDLIKTQDACYICYHLSSFNGLHQLLKLPIILLMRTLNDRPMCLKDFRLFFTIPPSRLGGSGEEGGQSSRANVTYPVSPSHILTDRRGPTSAIWRKPMILKLQGQTLRGGLLGRVILTELFEGIKLKARGYGIKHVGG